MACELLNSVQMHKSFPKRLEEQVARLSAYMNLPEPASGDLFFRLVRMPAKGRETVVDINSCGFRYRVRITRFLKSLRRSLLNCESPKPNLKQAFVPPVEISSSYLDAQSPTIRLLEYLNFDEFVNDLEDDPTADHFFLFHTNSKDFGCRAITNPHHKKWPENWTLLINHTYGLELFPPRRLVYDEVGEGAV